MVKAMSKNVIDVVVSWASDGADGEAFPHEAYADAVAACARTAEQVYDMLDDALDPRFRSDGAPRAQLRLRGGRAGQAARALTRGPLEQCKHLSLSCSERERSYPSRARQASYETPNRLWCA